VLTHGVPRASPPALGFAPAVSTSAIYQPAVMGNFAILVRAEDAVVHVAPHLSLRSVALGGSADHKQPIIERPDELIVDGEYVLVRVSLCELAPAVGHGMRGRAAINGFVPAHGLRLHKRQPLRLLIASWVVR
jgi:hypothetical protein